jgi:hypothetical protein
VLPDEEILRRMLLEVRKVKRRKKPGAVVD